MFLRRKRLSASQQEEGSSPEREQVPTGQQRHVGDGSARGLMNAGVPIMLFV